MRTIKVQRWHAGLMSGVGVAATIGVFVTMGWSAALVIGVFLAGVSVVRYGIIGANTSGGAILASRPDELHAHVRLQVRAYVAVIALLSAITAAAITQAAGGKVWPYEAVAGVGVGFFLLDILVYGSSRGGAPVGLRQVFGSRADERQVELRLHALQLAAMAMALASTAGLLAFTGRRADGPFEILDAVLGASFIGGIVISRLKGDSSRV